MIASHYAEPLDRVLKTATALRSLPSNDSELVAQMSAGDTFAMLDNSLGWAWGYAGSERRVGYVPSDCLATG